MFLWTESCKSEFKVCLTIRSWISGLRTERFGGCWRGLGGALAAGKGKSESPILPLLQAWKGLEDVGGALKAPWQRVRENPNPLYYLCSKPGSLETRCQEAWKPALPAWPGLAGLAGLAGWLGWLDWRVRCSLARSTL